MAHFGILASLVRRPSRLCHAERGVHYFRESNIIWRLHLNIWLFVLLSTPLLAQNTPVTVIYTGKLFGYYNQELLEIQIACLQNQFHSDHSECTSDSYRNAAANDAQNTSYVRSFLKDPDVIANSQRSSQSVLVGMGDNFAPEIESRLQRYQWSENRDVLDESTSLASRTGRELLYPLKRLAARPGHAWHEPESLDGAMRALQASGPDEVYSEAEFAAQDNVGNFLLLAGYTALVPGREDLLYGSVRLAKLSDLLRTDTNGSLHMLAANLRYQKVGASSKRSCPLLLGMTHDQSGVLQANIDADACDPKHRPSPSDLAVATAALNNVGYKLVPLPDDPTEKILIIGVVAYDFLSQISVINKTFTKTRNSADRYTLIVTDPQNEIDTILRGLSGEKIAKTVLLAQMPRGDAEILGEHFARSKLCSTESPQLFSLVEQCRKHTIDVVISEADEAQASEEETVTKPALENHLIVVTPHPAYSSFTKALVPNPISVLTMASQVEYHNVAKWQFPPVGSPLAQPTSLTVASERFKELVVTRQSFQPNHYGISDPDIEVNETLSNREIATRMLRSVQAQTGTDVVLIQRRDLFFDKPADEYDRNENCTRIANATDKNDCYLRNQFQRMLWKGDVVTTINLTGQQIVNILQTSKQLGETDSVLTTKDITKQWLVTFGIWQPRQDEGNAHSPDSCPAVSKGDREQYESLNSFKLPSSCHCHAGANASTSATDTAFCIDGKEIDTSRVYMVATTDSLATGSEIYTDFKKPAVGTIDDLPHGGRTGDAGFVENVLDCWHTVSQVNASVPSPRCASTWPAVNAGNIPEGEIGDECALTDTHCSGQRKGPTVSAMNDDIYEFEHQERGILHYQLQQLLVSFNEYHPNQSDYALGQTFGGVSDSRVLQPHNSTVDIENNFRMLWESRHYDFGVTDLLAYTKNIKGSVTGAANNVSYSNNQFSVGPVFQLHLGSDARWGRFAEKGWNSKTSPNYKLVVSLFQVTGQVQRSRFAFPDDSSITKQNPPLSLSLERVFEPNLQWGAGPRIGFRHEFFGGSHWFYPDKTSYMEGGYQFSFQRSVLTGLQLINPNNSSAFQIVTCSLEGGAGLAACVKAAQTADKDPTDVIVGPNTTFKGLYAPGTVFARGWYWLGSLNFPLSKSKTQPISALLQGNGDYFNDLGTTNQYATQTRFDVTTSLGIQFPVWGNLSFVPNYTLFLYENQNNRNWLAARTVAISLRWSFDRNSAIGPGIALAYKSPNTTSSTSATTPGSSAATH